MSTANPLGLMITRRNVIALVVVEVVLFALANVTANSPAHPGTASQVTWWAFLIGLLLLIVISVNAWLRRLRAAR